MVVQVEGMDISPTEISEKSGWCTIARRERLSPGGKHANPNIPPASQAGVGGTNTAQRRPRAHKQQILKAEKMPTLPRDHHKVVIRPRGGLNVATVRVVRLASALYRAASVSPQDAMEDIVCPNIQQNIIVVSTPHSSNAERYRRLVSFELDGHKLEIRAYETAPDYTVKGVVRGIPLEEDVKVIHLNIVNKRNPAALAAKRLSKTTSVIIAFAGDRVPTWVYYGGAMLRCTLYRKQIDVCHQCGRVGHRMDVCPNPQDRVCRGCGASNPDPNHKCTPRCRLCGGAHPTADKTCMARFKTPYLVKKRRGDRQRAEAEAALELQQQNYDEHFPPASRSRSRGRTRSRSAAGTRSRQQSRSRSRARSRTPGQSRGRSSSRRPKQAGHQDVELPDKVSWADAVKGSLRRGAHGATASEPSNKRGPRDVALEAVQRENAQLRTVVQQLTQEIREIKQSMAQPSIAKATSVPTPVTNAPLEIGNQTTEPEQPEIAIPLELEVQVKIGVPGRPEESGRKPSKQGELG
ncbi:hypothetical protein HPB49_008883 [Dermacentor silvarum]|uniref:Uncharacterized protein n=1 Tax=Dermacentor silvarum TaxID=543639 RepID=A0ACB8DXJ5_DERSI|nr:hypothetical protein HPB49_008883 [Dermacentor silvarum]